MLWGISNRGKHCEGETKEVAQRNTSLFEAVTSWAYSPFSKMVLSRQFFLWSDLLFPSSCLSGKTWTAWFFLGPHVRHSRDKKRKRKCPCLLYFPKKVSNAEQLSAHHSHMQPLPGRLFSPEESWLCAICTVYCTRWQGQFCILAQNRGSR